MTKKYLQEHKLSESDRLIKRLARDYYRDPKVMFGVFVELVAAAIGGVIPLTLQWSLSGRTITSRTWLGIALFFGLMVVQGAMSGGGRYLLAKPADIWINRIRNKVFGHAIRMPMNYLDSHSSGELANHTINDIHTLETYVTDDIPGLISGGLQGLIIIAVMFVIDWPTAIAMFAIDVIGMGLALLLSVRITSYAGQRQGNEAKLNGTATDLLHSIRTVKANTAESDAEKRFGVSSRSSLSIAIQIDKFLAFYYPLQSLNNIFMEFCALLVVVLRVSFGAISVGSALTLVTYFFEFVGPMNSVSSFFLSRNQSKGSIAWIVTLLQQPTEREIANSKANNTATITTKTSQQKNAGTSAGLTLTHASFSYSAAGSNSRDKGLIIRDVSISVTPGHQVAIVGHTGAGKSTIASLLLRLYPLKSGSLTLNGKTADSIPLDQWRTDVAVVSLDTGLTLGTLRENITFGLPRTPSDEELRQALTVACLNDEEHPLDLDATTGEDGLKLSGGQRERVQVARAVLRHPSYLILDEATANLDSRTEKRVLANLRKALPDTGIISIAHRLSTITDSDHIYFLANGRVEGEGTHRELFESLPAYHRLAVLQGLTADGTHSHDE